MQTINTTNSKAPVTAAQLQQIRDSLEMAHSRLPPLTASDLGSVKAQSALHLLVSELTRTLTVLRGLTGTEAVLVEPSAAAARVFGTRELLEMIFEHLHPLDLLRATQTCRATAHLLAWSRRTRRAMCLEADDKADAFLPFHQRDDVDFQTTTKLTSWRDSYVGPSNVVVRLNWDDKLPRLGARAQSILVCVPPVKEATLSLGCCPDHNTRNIYEDLGRRRRGFGDQDNASESHAVMPVEDKISSVSGITVGDILAATQKRRDDHRLCPFADVDRLDKDGFVRVSVRFTMSRPERIADKPSTGIPGYLVFADSDEDADSSDDDAPGGIKHMLAYAKAKREAYGRGLRVPTLAEYDAQVIAGKYGEEDRSGGLLGPDSVGSYTG